MKTVGLCMIVKNESGVIAGCLDSVRPFVDYVLVEDTGSTDGTQDIVRDWLRRQSLPGAVIEEPFQSGRIHRLARRKDDREMSVPQGVHIGAMRHEKVHHRDAICVQRRSHEGSVAPLVHV